MKRFLALALGAVSALAQAHPGHGAPAMHVHLEEILAAGAVIGIAAVLAAVALRRSRRRGRDGRPRVEP